MSALKTRHEYRYAEGLSEANRLAADDWRVALVVGPYRPLLGGGDRTRFLLIREPAATPQEQT